MSDGMNTKLENLQESISVFDAMSAKAPGVVMYVIDITGLNIESGAKNYCTVGVAGWLRSSIHYKPNREKLEGEVDVNQSYGPYVEHGTPPHMPPVEALKLWAERILGDEALAWPVAMAIKEYGTQAQPFLFPATEDERPKYGPRMAEAFSRLNQ